MVKLLQIFIIQAFAICFLCVIEFPKFLHILTKQSLCQLNFIYFLVNHLQLCAVDNTHISKLSNDVSEFVSKQIEKKFLDKIMDFFNLLVCR